MLSSVALVSCTLKFALLYLCSYKDAHALILVRQFQYLESVCWRGGGGGGGGGDL